MSATIISGKETAKCIRSEIAQGVGKLQSRGVTPGLAVVLVGEDPASLSYVSGKKRGCQEVGFYAEDIHLPETTTQEELLGVVEELNTNPKIHGILVQLPLPKHINEELVIQAIAPEKDVDGFHPMSLGRMLAGLDTFVSCTPAGVVELLLRNNITIEGKHVVIVGRSNIVGKPLATLLLQKGARGNATVTVCHSRTPDIGAYARQADILVAAVGIPELIKADMLKPGVVVVDVGVNRVEDSSKKRGYRLVGDVEFEPALEIASAITPVPGGVGPMTITMLLANTLQSAERAATREESGRV